MISVSTRRLSVFKSVVDCGGFNLAAERLGISQPSVGAHINALEYQLGQSLFIRSRGRRPALTKAGEAIYAYAVDVLQKSQATTQALAEIRSAVRREITIAVHRDIEAQFLATRLTAFRTQHPQVRVVTRISTIDEVISHIRSRAANLGMFLAAGPISGMRSQVLGGVPLALVVSPDHPLAGQRSLPAQTLSRHSFVTGLHGSSFAALVDAALKKIGVDHHEIAMEVEESSATKELVRRGTGIACLPRGSVAAELAARTLVELPTAVSLPDLELRCGYVVPLAQAARDFLRCLKSGR